MIDWTTVIDNDFAVPDDLGSAVGELVAMLASPDPEIRDHQAYAVLVTWTDRGVLDPGLADVGDAMVARLRHPEVQARTFAPLILAAAVDRDAGTGVLEPEVVPRWRDAFAGWWPAEADPRGWDERLGWLHAIAHGADLAGALGASRRMQPADVSGLLTVTAERFVAPTDYRYAQMEEDRVAAAMTRMLGRPDIGKAEATAWLAVVDRLFASGEPGPLPIEVANTLAVLRSLYVMADRGSMELRETVTDAVAARLHECFAPYPAVRAWS